MAADDHEDLLDYYLRELTSLQNEAHTFAARYPRVAGGLGISADELGDPQIEHLLHSVAYLTARLQRRLDRQTAAIAADVLNLLYPLFDAPLPSMAVAHFPVDAAQSRTANGARLPAGTEVEARGAGALVCRFRTAGDVTLWPVEITAVDLLPASEFAFLDGRPDVQATLRLRLRATGASRFGEIKADPLRFFIGGLRPRATRLADVLVGHGRGAFVRPLDAAEDVGATLPAPALRPFGLEDDEALLPLAPAADPACRLLLEYFVYPLKHLLFDLVGLGATPVLDGAREAELHLLLDRPPAAGLEPAGVEVRTNAAPLINLFRQISEPIRVDQTRASYRLDPDRLRARTTEIFRVESVVKGPLGEPDGAVVEPLYGFHAAHLDSEPRAFWQARRQPTRLADAEGSDVELAFLDRDLEPTTPAIDVAYAHTLCTNRGLAHQLPAGHRLELQVEMPLATARLITAPTPQAAPLTARGAAWQLVSQLSLNHLAVDGEAGLAALKEIIRLYAGPGGTTAARQIEALMGLSAETAVRRIGRDAWRGFTTGTLVELEVDREGFVGAGPVLFGQVLERFLARVAAVNSFSELRLHTRQEPEVVYRWPPRCGQIPLL